MQDPEEKQYLFDKPENVSRLLRGFYLICGILFLLDFVLHRHISILQVKPKAFGLHRHISIIWEKIPGFYALFGFVACVILVLVAKEMRKFLMRKEDYYDVDE